MSPVWWTVGSLWLACVSLVLGFLWEASTQQPDPLRTPAWDDEMGYRRKIRKLARDATNFLPDDAEVVRPMSCAKPRRVFCEEMRDPDRMFGDYGRSAMEDWRDDGEDNDAESPY